MIQIGGKKKTLPIGRHASESNNPIDIFLRRTFVRLDGTGCGRELATCVFLKVSWIRLGHSTLSSDKRNVAVTVQKTNAFKNIYSNKTINTNFCSGIIYDEIIHKNNLYCYQIIFVQ